ncbi:hypothetical protein QQS21_009567 [Conoideocrella luteorostrata]|uniref:Uncharacterized protein n=1 Tax=Conoideocrella luteorostrata TaxID=1105319 RepID=A0AAJ0FUY2_9HYPO|nr:hypothetical protein QQS21_009567 [Conoideocrella luteorostrata]
MGFLNFLHRRSSRDGASDRSFSLQSSRSVLASSRHSLATSNVSRRASFEKLYNAAESHTERQQVSGTSMPYRLGIHADTVNSDSLPLATIPRAGNLHRLPDIDAKPPTHHIPHPSFTSSKSLKYAHAPGYIDLLDAHGGIRPYDFRSRVQAAGVRDYGEDVAERNMGENGVDVRSAASRKFYARQNRSSLQTPSIASHGQEPDQSTYGGSTYGGSEAGEGSLIDDLTATTKRPVPRLVLEPRQEISGVVAGRPSAQRSKSWDSKSFVSATGSASHHPGSQRNHFNSVQSSKAARHSASERSREQPNTGRYWISTERPVIDNVSNSSRWESRPCSGSRSRSMSPPNVPRYRPRNRIAAMDKEDGYSNAGHGMENCSEHTTYTKRALTPGLDSRSVSLRGEFQSGGLDRGCVSNSEDDSELGISLPAVHIRAAKPRLVAVAPPPHRLEWQNAVRRAVEESLANLPLSADLKAILELSENDLTLNDISQKVPVRHSSLRQGFTTCSSTPTTDLSDYSSGHTERPHSRQTTTTSIASSSGTGVYRKTGSTMMMDGGSSVGDDCHSSPTIAVADYDTMVTTGIPTEVEHELRLPELCKGISQRNGIMEIDSYECLTSDFSDVDSFTEKRRHILNDDESLLFNDDGFGDLGTNLPGLVAHNTNAAPNDCMICHIVANLQGSTVSSGSCSHNGSMSRKQRLRALGYDYDSDESDPEPVRASALKRGRTKKLIGGSGGGLRRLKLVDDRIDEASEEERGAAGYSQPRHEVRRKSKFVGQEKGLPSIVVHDDGNIADTE